MTRRSKATRLGKGPSKRPKKKAVRPSTTRSTAGPGFDFEDHVAAWLLLKTLTGQPLPGVDGIAHRLQMQVESIGWTIDDILLTATTSPDDQRHLAISCKSNVQVTASRLPAEFVTRCWQQWAKLDANPMQRGKDRLMLVARGRNNAFMATWSELKNAAPGADLALALGRMRATGKHLKLFDSVKAPAKDAGVTPSDDDIVAIVNTIEVVPVDFHVANSEDEKLAIGEARTLLVNGSLDEGRLLWSELLLQAKKTRLGTGTLEMRDLWRQLRVTFKLKDHPDYQASWAKLRELTQDHRSTIETALTSGLTLDRSSEADKLVERLDAGMVCVVFGESGGGKSALVKATLDDRFPDAAQVWLGPETLDLALNEATRVGLGIGQPLIEGLDAPATAGNFLVLDAAERLTHGCALKAKALIEELNKRNTADAKAGWRVLIVGQTEAWISGTLQEVAGVSNAQICEVRKLPDAMVRATLRSL